jgi:hypothetical protein
MDARMVIHEVVRFEIPVDDAARAKEFYRAAFEWELNDSDMGDGNTYTTVITTPVDEQTRSPPSAARSTAA